MQEANGAGRDESAWPRWRRSGPAVAAIGAAGLIALGALISPTRAAAQDRVYEKVSPNGKNLGDVVHVPAAADDGNAVVFTATGVEEGSMLQVAVTVGRRTATGWKLTDTLPPSAEPPASQAALLTATNQFSEDLTRLAFETNLSMVPEDVDVSTDIFVFDSTTGNLRWLQAGFTDLGSGGQVGEASQFVGASRDLGHIFVRSGRRGLPGAPRDAVYEWLPDGTVRVASILPNGTPTAGLGPVSPGFRTGLGNSALGGGPVREGGAPHVVSDDGSRFFFTTTTNGPLYVRIDGSRTVEVSKDRRTGGTGIVMNATFVGATPDGSRVWFNATSPLTDDAPSRGGLYRFDVDTEQLTFLTPETTPSPLGPRIVGAMVSDDGSRVYLIARGVLAPGAINNQYNFYVLDDAGIRLIGIVEASARIARVSRNGRYALVRTTASLNGAPTNGKRALYLYDAVEDKLACVSCRPDGSPSQGDADVDRFEFGGTVSGGNATNARALTDDGQVFFTTEDRLLPADFSAARDVYGYHDGKLELISSGRSAYHSDYMDNSDDGRDVFFVTRDSLVPGDDDGGLLDLYDARRGGGFPSSSVHPTAACSGDGCQESPLRRAVLPSPGSALVSGPGNVVPAADDDEAVERSFSVARLSATRRRQLARTGRTTVSVRLRGGGAIRVRARARIGGRTRTIGSGSRTVRQTRTLTVRVPLRLTTTARRQLRAGRRLRVTIEVRVTGVEAAKRTTLNLKGARS